MSRCSEHHKRLNVEGVGKCSVPMWGGGLPAGFCDNEAYGERPRCKEFRGSDGVLRRIDGLYDGHIPFLACPGHGGPQENKKAVLSMDGNQHCATRPQTFINLQESHAGFGDTGIEAMAALIKDERG